MLDGLTLDVGALEGLHYLKVGELRIDDRLLHLAPGAHRFQGSCLEFIREPAFVAQLDRRPLELTTTRLCDNSATACFAHPYDQHKPAENSCVHR